MTIRPINNNLETSNSANTHSSPSNNKRKLFSEADLLSELYNKVPSDTNQSIDNENISPFKKRKITNQPTTVTPLLINPFLVPEFNQNSFAAPSASYSKKVPETPRKMKSNAYTQLCKQAQQGEIEIKDKKIGVTLYSNEGSYRDVFTIQSNEPVIEGIENSEVVLKLFNTKISNDNENRLIKISNQTKQNYESISQHVPVASIYNISSMIEDKCILQEKINHKLDINNSEHIQQAKSILMTACRKNILIDAQPENFRVRENGTIVLIDFVESNSSNPQIFINKAIKKFAKVYKETNSANEATVKQFLELITKEIAAEGFYSLENNKEILEELFFSPFQFNKIGL